MIVIFWIASLLLFHTYILYPFILWLLTINSKPRSTAFTLEDELPFVSVIMAAHNEEMVIGQKIDSIFKTGYPATKIELLVGSDCSTDGTNAIITQKKEEYGAVTFMEFMQRDRKSVV